MNDSTANSSVESANPGFEQEGLPPKEPTERPMTKNEVRKRNLAAVFGHGPGKFSLIAIAMFIVIAFAFAMRQLTAPPPVVKNTSRVDVATAPDPQINVKPISEAEAQRRAAIAAAEAKEAEAKGKGYQPSFDPKIAPVSSTQTTSGNPPAPNGAPATQVQIAIDAGRGTQPTSNNPAAPANQQLTAEQEAAIRAEKLALEEKEKRINTIRTQVIKQIGENFGVGENANDNGNGPTISRGGTYSKVTYPSARATQQAGLINGAPTQNVDRANVNDNRKLLIKTADRTYAELDSELNTDDGSDVFATIRGGKWNGASIIGKIVHQPNNVSLRFTTLAPADNRPTMKIEAVALRIEDGKLGMAETIDHHTLSRYSALGFASLLGGAGRAYSQPVGTSVVTNGQVITTTAPPTDRQIIGAAIGELGTNAASEIRRGFDQKTTYKAPAQKGFILYFVQDVYEQKNGN